MSAPKQRTLSRSVTLDGTGLHTGKRTSVTLRPAETGTGLRFRRVDLDGEPDVPARLEHVEATELGTTLARGEATVRTVEHVLSALHALSIDNALIDVDGPEPPVRDGSFRDFVAAIDDAGPVDQSAEVVVMRLREALTVPVDGGGSYVVGPAAELRISATIDFEHRAIGRQSGSFLIAEEEFRRSLAPARTFGFLAEAEALRARGFARGASLENAVVLDESGVMNGDLRFDDEFLRHKIGDIVGDLALLGARIEAHIVADRPSHSGNVALARALQSHPSHS